MTTEITAAVLRARGEPFALEAHVIEDPRPDEILVRIHSTGLCHTDIAVRDQHLPLPLPMIVGHEGAGVVERVGSEITHVAPGDHVVLVIDSCGDCAMCRAGYNPYCVNLRQLNLTGCRTDGSCRIVDEPEVRGAFFGQSSFATYALGTRHNVVKVPKDLDLAVLGQLGCGIQTGAGAVLNRLKPAPGSSLLVCGAGPVGIAAVMAAKVAGCGTIAVLERSPGRLRAASEFGATHAIDGALGEEAYAQLRQICPEGFDNVVETTGAAQVIDQAVPLVRPLGTCVLLAPGASVTLPLSSMMSGGRNVCGHSCGHISSDVFIPRMIDLWREGRFPIDRLITRFPFDQINAACAAAERGDVVKAVLMMPGSV